MECEKSGAHKALSFFYRKIVRSARERFAETGKSISKKHSIKPLKFKRCNWFCKKQKKQFAQLLFFRTFDTITLFA